MSEAFKISLTALALLSPHTQRVGYAVDIVKPGSKQRDLEDGPVVKASGPKAFVILTTDTGGVARQLGHIVEHGLVLFRDWRRFVVRLQRLHQLFV